MERKIGKLCLDMKVLKRNFFVGFFYDLLYYILVAVGFLFVARLGMTKAKEFMDRIDFTALFSTNIDLINQNYSHLKMILFWIFLWIFLFAVLCLLLFTFFKGIIWLRMNHKKFSWKFFFKYLRLNLIYFGIATPILGLFYFYNLIDVFFVFFLIFFYFYTIACHFIVGENGIIKTIKKSFSLGIKEIGLVISYLIAMVGFFLLNYLFSHFNSDWKILFNVLFYIIYFVCYKIYLNEKIKEVAG